MYLCSKNSEKYKDNMKEEKKTAKKKAAKKATKKLDCILDLNANNIWDLDEYAISEAWERERAMARARKDFDWEGQFDLALDKSKPRKYRDKCELDDDEMCAMCGEYCAVKIAKGDF